jgi:hypothetical protein
MWSGSPAGIVRVPSGSSVPVVAGALAGAVAVAGADAVAVAAAVAVAGALAGADAGALAAVDGRVVAAGPPHAAAKTIKAAADMLRYLSFISSVSSSCGSSSTGRFKRSASRLQTKVRCGHVGSKNFGGLIDRWYRRKTTLCLPF